MKDRLSIVRKQSGLTMKKFADRIGCTVSSISCYESGKRTPSNAVIQAICREFHIRHEWLVEGTGEMMLPAVESPTPGILAANYENLPEHIMTLVDALAKMDPDWYRKINDAIDLAMQKK